LDDFNNIRDKLDAIDSLSLDELINCAFKSGMPRRPLADLSFGLNYYFHGHNLPGYHVVNITIHVLNGVLLYIFLFKTITLPQQRHTFQNPAGVAMLGSLLWFVNPVQIQSVTYIVQRMTSMACLFFLCSFLLYLHARQAEKTRTRVALVALCVVTWVFSMASKEIALTLPVLLFVYEWFFFQDLDGAWLKRKAIYLATGLAGLLTAVYFLYHYSPLDFLTTISLPRGYTALERFLTQGRVIFAYIGLLLYPHPSRLSLNHDISVSHSLLNPFTTLVSFTGLLIVIVLGVVTVRRHRIVSFCVIWFLANVAIEALSARIELMFEHRAYLSSMLFFLLLVWTATKVVNRPRIVFLCMSALALIFALWTYQRNALWNDPIAFWEDAVKKAPNHYRTHANLGISCLHGKLYDRALEAFQKALTLAPPHPSKIYTNLGVAYFQTGQQDLARKNLIRAVVLNPKNYVALSHLGNVELKTRNHEKALRYYQMATEINPNLAASYYKMGRLYTETGKLDNAIKSFRQAVQLRPMWSEAYSSLGLALAWQEEYDLAISAFRKAVKINPQNQEALFNLATAYNTTGRYGMAVQAYKNALAINPKDTEAMHNLGIIHLKHLKNFQQAALYFKKALVTDPGYAKATTARDVLIEMGVKP
jgi:tetratricopeptide (TPR) repeat protein